MLSSVVVVLVGKVSSGTRQALAVTVVRLFRVVSVWSLASLMR
jgi:hypothetical protein